MCETCQTDNKDSSGSGTKTVPVDKAVGMILPHDITEIRPGEFKGRAFKKGHIICEEDIEHLKRLGKENLFILEIKDDEMHENDAAYAIAAALAGKGIRLAGEPNEGKINLVAETDGLLYVNREALLDFNMLGEVMCATIHNNSVVKKGQLVAGTRAIPLVVKKSIVDEAVKIAESIHGVLNVKEIRKPRAGIVITGNEVYHGRIKDAFEPVIRKKIKGLDGEIVGVHFAPDNVKIIEDRIRELIDAGADLIITSGGMSVDPDDVTRFAIRNLGVSEMHYGSPVLPGSMFLVAYLETENSKFEIRNSKLTSVPILGIPACGMYADITVFDLVLPRILAGEKIGRKELAGLGHGGLCLKCKECRYPVCPFGK
ncbi:MAG: molybdopterin-binding protein [Nitrospirae bacterium]|nr:molybdopterin-binding protein [Nitrospirota bacterium]